MNPRSKKYYETKTDDNGDKKGSANKEGYNEQNDKNVKQSPENPAPTTAQDKPNADDSTATQDDTGGGNDSGKRSDEI